MLEGLPALCLVEIAQIVFQLFDWSATLAADDLVVGEDFEGLVVELGDVLAPVAPHHPPPVGIRP